MNRLKPLILVGISILLGVNMTFAENTFENPEEKDYKLVMAEVYDPLLQKIDAFDDREVRDFFGVLLDASERVLRGVVLSPPDELDLKKRIKKDDAMFWLRKVSLTLLAYSCHYYDYPPGMEIDPDSLELMEMSYKAYWQRMVGSYNRLFSDSIRQKEIDFYAAGLKEDDEKGYSKSGNMDKAFELMVRDYLTIGSELLENIWGEKLSSAQKEILRGYHSGSGMKGLDPTARKALYLGVCVWGVYQQIVQPFLEKLVKEY